MAGGACSTRLGGLPPPSPPPGRHGRGGRLFFVLVVLVLLVNGVLVDRECEWAMADGSRPRSGNDLAVLLGRCAKVWWTPAASAAAAAAVALVSSVLAVWRCYHPPSLTASGAVSPVGCPHASISSAVGRCSGSCWRHRSRRRP